MNDPTSTTTTSTATEAPVPSPDGAASRERFLTVHARALLVALAVLGATGALWWSLREHEAQLIYIAGAGESPRVRSDMVEGLRGRLLALRALGRRWEGRAPDERLWKAEADSVLKLPLQFRGIQWLDRDLAIRWTMPAGARLPGAALDSAADAIRIDELRALLTEADPTVSRSFPLPDAPRQILMCAPLHDGGRVTGYLVGVLRANDVIDALVREPVERGYSVQVTEGVFHVYGPVWLEGGEESTFGKESALRVGDLDWKVMVWPSAESLRDLRTPLLHLVLALGIALAIVLGVAADRSARAARDRAGIGAASTAPESESEAVVPAAADPPGEERAPARRL